MAGAGLFWLGNPMMILVAGFVFFAGQQELWALRQREAIRRAPPVDVLPVEPVRVVEPTEVLAASEGWSPYTQVRPGFTGVAWDQRFRVWVRWYNGRPVAVYGTGAE
jgi:hypothetical protein